MRLPLRLPDMVVCVLWKKSGVRGVYDGQSIGGDKECENWNVEGEIVVGRETRAPCCQ